MISYVDDILIAIKTREGNLEIVDAVLDRIQKTVFIVIPVKAQMLQQGVTYLGTD